MMGFQEVTVYGSTPHYFAVAPLKWRQMRTVSAIESALALSGKGV